MHGVEYAVSRCLSAVITQYCVGTVKHITDILSPHDNLTITVFSKLNVVMKLQQNQSNIGHTSIQVCEAY